MALVASGPWAADWVNWASLGVLILCGVAAVCGYVEKWRKHQAVMRAEREAILKFCALTDEQLAERRARPARNMRRIMERQAQSAARYWTRRLGGQ